MANKVWGKDDKKHNPVCKICNDDGKPCQRCGTGITGWIPPPSRGATEFSFGPTISGSGSTTMQDMVNKSTTSPGAKLPGRGWQSGKNCSHTGEQLAFTLRGGDVSIYGARGDSLIREGANIGHLDLILDLAGIVKPRKFVLTGPRRIIGLNSLAFPEVVNLHWPDMTAPNHVRLAFWVRLLDILPAHVAIACMGSHGRTGTAMAALLIADGMGAVEAMAKVRESHCSSAIESAAQEKYLMGLK